MQRRPTFMEEARATILDPVHGSIRVTGLEYALLQTPLLQRLHGVKQLSMSYMIYPQAKHSRMEHSLGVMHLAGEAAGFLAETWPRCMGLENTVLQEKFVQIARLAGLLHDIGHPPFSHAFEDVLDRIAAAEEQGDLRVFEGLLDQAQVSEIVRVYDELRRMHERRGIRGRYHELATVIYVEKVISGASDFLAAYDEASRLSPAELEAVIDVFRIVWRSGDGNVGGLRGFEQLGMDERAAWAIAIILSNPIADVDRLDYLPRDAYNAGVVFGSIDYERLITSMRVAEDEDGGVVIEIDSKGVPALEDVFDARFKMFRSVYYHHKNLAYTLALSMAIAALISSWEEVALESYLKALRGPTSIFKPQELVEAIYDGSIAFDDSEFMVMMRRMAGLKGPAGRWARALVADRRLLPISVVKRMETFMYGVVTKAYGSVGGGELSLAKLGDKATGAVGGAIAWIEEEVARIASSLAGVDRDDVLVLVWPRQIITPELAEDIVRGRAGRVRIAGAQWSPYILSVVQVGSLPLLGVYVFSHDEESHLKLYKVRRALRKEAQSKVEEILVEKLKSLGGPGKARPP